MGTNHSSEPVSEQLLAKARQGDRDALGQVIDEYRAYGAIAGVSAFNAWPFDGDVNDEFDQSWGEAAFATRVSSFQEFILSATNNQAVFVPEPSPLFIAAFFAIGLRLRQRGQCGARVIEVAGDY